MNETVTINDSLYRSVQQLEYYKELCQVTLDQCDNSFMETKKIIIEDFDTLITYLSDRKIEILTQLAIELESHKQDLEKNIDRSNLLIQKLNKKISTNNTSSIRNSNGRLHSSDSRVQPPQLSHSKSYSNIHNSSGGSSTIVGLGSKSYSSMNQSYCDLKGPLNKSMSFDDVNFKTEQLQLLKQSVQVINWNWIGEFQNTTTRVKIVRSETPMSPRSDIDQQKSGEHSPRDNESISSSSTSSIQSPSKSSSSPLKQTSISSSSSATLLRNNGEKLVNQYGRLEFKTKQNEEYQELKSIFPRNEYIYSIGGKLNGFDQYALERFDSAECGGWRSLSPVPSMDNDFAAVYDQKNYIYLFGGSLAPTRILKYSILDDRWERLKIEIPDGGRFLHSAIYDQKQFIYLIGGFPKSTHILKFNLFTEEFSRQSSLSKSLWNTCALYDDKSMYLLNHSLLSVAGSSGMEDEISSSFSQRPCIYLIGGCNVSRQSRSTFERYDIEEDRFYEMPPLLNSMYSGGAVLDQENGYIYVVGGFSSVSNECLSRVERFSFQRNQWELLSSSSSLSDDTTNPQPQSDTFSTSDLPVKMTICNSIFLDDKNQNIYVIGGYNQNTKEYYDRIFKFSLITFKWDTQSTVPPYQYSKQKGGSSIYISK
ncbi:Kelch repeat-containing protein [Tieghemostelium lacteum]|uniref:Kelch repeat-containing protein n=1 Tax=Tieghemostelium lacteum TaxID=361077 RepID=A0A151Z737_TIELA|nr:Kelch repeat-containing protein [Tieghemostelium lacteum]|eukprot:KYQ89773.1 Kelch repeat-containing protein [Tieghemostelium lacteum]